MTTVPLSVTGTVSLLISLQCGEKVFYKLIKHFNGWCEFVMVGDDDADVSLDMRHFDFLTGATGLLGRALNSKLKEYQVI
ncbi:hypothetical protein J2S06_003217 [Bacillus alveayuensis]|jgi:hypothetical protein|uniref:Uncharacterized protein n=1 Tax=Aeribacillus alveayuensis TaxID=279215 RepID=A0ABT9VT92_9BACI|nr:hypothetical protein [Bacillus alveayuensis]